MVIFDFDGVLMDSMEEVAVSAYNACTAKLVTRAHDLPNGLLDKFRSYRSFMRTPAEAIPLMTWCLARANGSDGGDLDRGTFEQCCTTSPGSSRSRRRRFFEARQRLTEKNPSAFFSLNRPYQPLWGYLSDYGKPIVILTTKNRQAVLKLCRHFELAINPGDIYSGDQGMTKTANMEVIHRRFEASCYFFIDDLRQNLMELKGGFVKEGVTLSLFLADWGYGTDEDAVFASTSGFGILDQKGAIDLLGSPVCPEPVP